MNKFLLAGSAAALAVGGIAAAEERTFPLTGFDAISASAGTDVEIKINPEYSIRAVGDAEEIDRLRIELDGKSLDIGRKHQGFSWRHRGQVTIYVTLPELKALDVSSGADVTASGVAGGAFALEASSGGQVEVSGNCDTLAADVSSGGNIEAETLQCKTGAASASSGGAMTIYVSETIVADASSGGNIDVAGAPKNVNIDKSSGGDVSVTD